jgi:PAS domain S-box-containing protein
MARSQPSGEASRVSKSGADEAQRRHALSHAVGLILSQSTSLERAAPHLLETIGEDLGWESGALWLVDEQAGVLRCGATWHAPALDDASFEAVSQQIIFPKAVGLPGRVWASGEPVWLADVLTDGGFLRRQAARAAGLHGAVFFPIRGSSGIHGVIEVLSQGLHPPDTELLETLTLLGDQIGQFVERTPAEAALSDRKRRPSPDLEDAPITRPSLHGRRSFWTRVTTRPPGTSLRHAWQWLTLVRTDDPVRRVLNGGFAALIVALIPIALSASLFGNDNAVLVLVDLVSVPIFAIAWWLNRRGTVLGALLLMIWAAVGIPLATPPSSYIDTETAVPLVFVVPVLIATLFIAPSAGVWALLLQSSVLGLQLAASDVPSHDALDFMIFGTLDLAAVSAFLMVGTSISLRALRASIAASESQQRLNIELEHRAVERRRAEARQAMQFAVTRLLVESATLDEAVPELLRAICQGAGWDLGGLWQVDPDGQVLRWFDGWQAPGLDVAGFLAVTRTITFAPNDGLPGRVWASGQPLWSSDIATEAFFRRAPEAAPAGLHTACAVPLRSGGAVTGVFELFSRQRRPADPDLMLVLTDIGSQIGQFVERARAEGALQDSEERFRALIERSYEAIALINADGAILYASPSTTRMLGYGLDEFVGHSALEFLHQDDLPHTTQIFAPVVADPGSSAIAHFRLRHQDGSWRWMEGVGTNLLAEPSVQAIVVNYRDITERRRAEAALRLFADAGAVLTSSLDFDATLAQVVNLAVPVLADWCLVDLDEPDGTVRRVASHHVDPDKAALLQELERRNPPNPAAPLGVPLVLRTGRSTLTPEVTAARLAMWARDADHLALLQAVGLRSQICVPLIAGGRTLGALSFLISESDRRFTSADVELAEELARRAAAAIDNAQLYAAERRARAEAETAERGVAFLASASAALAATLDYEPTLRAVARLALPDFADFSHVYLVQEDGRVYSVEFAHVIPAKEEMSKKLIGRYPSYIEQDDHPVVVALRTGRTTIVHRPQYQSLEETLPDPELRRLTRLMGFRCGMVVPLVAGGRVLGAITLAITESKREFGPAEVALAEELARRAAVAIDNARLYEAEQQARQAAERAADRTARLQAITAALSEALTPERAAAVISEQSMTAMGAYAARVGLLSAGGTDVTLLYAAGYLGEQPTLHPGWSYFNPGPSFDAVQTGELVAVTSRAERDARYPNLIEVSPGGSEAIAAVPLTVEGRTIGVLTLSFAAPRTFSEEDRTFLLALAQLCAQALERARLQHEANVAAAAREADRLKTELLNTVSHELRTPLAAIKGFATTLALFGEQLSAEEQREFLDEIDGATDRLEELIDNLLHLARLESGILRMERGPVMFADVLHRSVEQARLRYSDRVISLTMESALPTVVGDARRLEQVAANLIDNAVKYSPSDQAVEVHAATAPDGSVELTVTDHGIGIAAEHQERVFEQFYRVDSEQTRAVGGTGLGLAICKRIVEAHGGRIAVTSAPGTGSTVTVTLPSGAGSSSDDRPRGGRG